MMNRKRAFEFAPHHFYDKRQKSKGEGGRRKAEGKTES